MFDAIPERPLMRGHVHLVAAILSPFALLTLVLAAGSPRAYVGGSIFGAGLVLLFTTSASYHLVPWLPRLRSVVRRIDHSMIFVAVAGFYTPFCLQVLGNAWGISVLAVVSGLGLACIVLKQAWPRAPDWLSLALYLAVGWTALVALVPLAAELSPLALTGLITSGLLYTGGGLAFVTGHPSPAPAIFGHHEVFHACVAAGCAILFVVVLTDVLPR